MAHCLPSTTCSVALAHLHLAVHITSYPARRQGVAKVDWALVVLLMAHVANVHIYRCFIECWNRQREPLAQSKFFSICQSRARSSTCFLLASLYIHAKINAFIRASFELHLIVSTTNIWEFLYIQSKETQTCTIQTIPTLSHSPSCNLSPLTIQVPTTPHSSLSLGKLWRNMPKGVIW